MSTCKLFILWVYFLHWLLKVRIRIRSTTIASHISLPDISEDREDSESSLHQLRPRNITNLNKGHPCFTVSQPTPTYSANVSTLTHCLYPHSTLSSTLYPPALQGGTWTVSCSQSPLRRLHLTLSPMGLSSSSLGAPLHHHPAASLHTSSLSHLPDKKQKPTIEKAVDIVKEKKKNVVDTLTKVLTCFLISSPVTHTHTHTHCKRKS